MRSLHNYFLLRNRRFFGARCLIVFLLVSALVMPIASNNDSARSPKTEPQRPKSPLIEKAEALRQMRLEADSDKPHTLAASYYNLQGNLKATLMLNNKGPKPLEVTPSLFSIYGDRFEIPPITVEGNSFLESDLSEWAVKAGPLFQEGSLQVSYKGPDLLLGAEVKLIDRRFSLMFDEQLVEPEAMFKSSRLEGVWWLPANHCRMNLILTNTTDESLSVSVSVSGEGLEQRDGMRLTLHPRETRVIDVRQKLVGKNSILPEAGGISIEHSGASGALLARGMIEETAMGYSSAIQFVDPANAKSSSLQGAGLRLGRVAGEDLTPVIVARNIGGTESVLTGRIPYTRSDGSNDAIPIKRVKLGPGEARVVSAGAEINRPQQEEVSAGLELEYDTVAGSVIVSALSTSRSRNHVFWLPIVDPASQQSSTGGYPWSIEKGSSTFVYIKNVTGKQQQYHLQLSYEVDNQEAIAGLYSPELVTIEGGETVALDIRKLRDEQVGDESGRKIPIEASRGQVLWSVRGKENLTLIGRAEQADFEQAVSSSYGCQNCCPDSFYDGWCDPQTVDGVPGSTTQFTSTQQDQNCYGTILSGYTVAASWSSNDESVATIDSGDGLATAIAPGSTDIFANWYVSSWLLLEGFPECIESEDPYFASAVCQVRTLAITITPATGIRPLGAGTGNTATVTVQTYPPGEGIQVSLTALAVVSSGGHISHSGTRPTGSFANSQGTTDANGEFQTTYTGPIFGGTIIIRAALLNSTVEEFLVIWVQGMFELGSGANYTLTGTTSSHPNNHFGTSTAVNNIPLIANDYKSQFYGEDAIPEADKLKVNDMSLIDGGKFDLSANWCASCSHQEHRIGVNCDMSSSNVPANRRQTLENIFAAQGSPNFLNEGDHWHLRFE